VVLFCFLGIGSSKYFKQAIGGGVLGGDAPCFLRLFPAVGVVTVLPYRFSETLSETLSVGRTL
jgi:hypothetical protein